MDAGRSLVIESISAHNLGRRTETEHVTSQNPFLKFEIGPDVYKTETKKHVGSQVFWNDAVKFSSLNGDVLTITALHRRGLIKHSKKFIGQGKIPVADLGASNSVTLKDKHKRTVGTVDFEIKGLVPLDSVSELTSEKTTRKPPIAVPAEAAQDAAPSPETPVDTEKASESPVSKDLPLQLEAATATHTRHSKRTTTSIITDTASILHERAPEQDAEAHKLIEAGKQKLLEDDRTQAILELKARENDSLVFSLANVCKLLLATNLAILDVIVVRLLELVGKPQYSPRNLFQIQAGKSPRSHRFIDELHTPASNSAVLSPSIPSDQPLADAPATPGKELEQLTKQHEASSETQAEETLTTSALEPSTPAASPTLSKSDSIHNALEDTAMKPVTKPAALAAEE